MQLQQAITAYAPLFQAFLACTTDEQRDAQLAVIEDATEHLEFDVAEQLYMHFECA